jgi:hypothetical protein
LAGTRRFFDAFFDLEPYHWQGFLSSRLYLMEVTLDTTSMKLLCEIYVLCALGCFNELLHAYSSEERGLVI